MSGRASRKEVWNGSSQLAVGRGPPERYSSLLISSLGSSTPFQSDPRRTFFCGGTFGYDAAHVHLPLRTSFDRHIPGVAHWPRKGHSVSPIYPRRALFPARHLRICSRDARTIFRGSTAWATAPRLI